VPFGDDAARDVQAEPGAGGRVYLHGHSLDRRYRTASSGLVRRALSAAGAVRFCWGVDFAAGRSSYCETIGYGKEEAMKYVMLIYQGSALERQAALPEDEQKQVYADYQGINETPGVASGPPMGLPENATTVRVEGGKTLTTDGPFVGMKEAVGGFFILEADDLDAAIEVASRVPAARYGGGVEIRPSEVYW
jgi:hypothetical protein